MTLAELKTLLKETNWFNRLTENDVDTKYIRIPSLAPWGSQPTGDALLEQLADEMEWLPSSRDQVDPIYGVTLEQQAESLSKKEEYVPLILDVYQTTLTSLRAFKGHPALRIGPHDFMEVARSSAFYAARRAAYEILLEKPAFWCDLIRLYHSGHWPCGILQDKRIVVL